MLYSLDEGVGRIMAKLRELRLDNDTVVIFTSDNGGVFGVPRANLPLRAGKNTLYEGGVRVPLIVRWPGVVPAGRTSDEPVATIDLYPTFVDLAGGKMKAGHVLDGVSLASLWRSGSDATLDRDGLFWHFPGYWFVANTGTWRTTPAGSIRSGRWSLIEFFEDNRIELYDLSTDLGQQRDLSRTEPETARRLLERLRAWRRAINAPMPTRNPRFRSH